MISEISNDSIDKASNLPRYEATIMDYYPG